MLRQLLQVCSRNELIATIGWDGLFSAGEVFDTIVFQSVFHLLSFSKLHACVDMENGRRHSIIAIIEGFEPACID